MSKKDVAMEISNARLISCIYFGLLAIVATILIDTILYLLGVEQLIPTFWAVILATIIAAIFGALFGEKIIHVEKKYLRQSFKWGFLMVLTSLPIYDIGLFYLMYNHHPESFTGATLENILYLYGLLLFYSFILVGLWLAILAGFAAMYLRAKLVYDILDSDAYEINDPLHSDTKTDSKT